MHLQSNAFNHTTDIPAQYTCEGQDVSPELSWQGEPAGTKTYALIADDPDAPVGTWTHWLIYNIPATTHELPHAFPHKEILEDGTMQGRNDFGKIGDGGPCPPSGDYAHRYYFRLFALNDTLTLEPGAKKSELEKAMHGKVLAQAELEGHYARHRD